VWGYLLCLGLPVGAQQPSDSREAEIASKQAEKAKTAKPYVPNRVERIIADLRREAIEAPSGIFPALDSVYSGGGFTLGAGYRQWFADAASWELKGLYSIKNYKLVETGLQTPVGEHFRVGTRVGWRDAPQAAYYGLGMDTTKADRANYTLQETYVDAWAAFRPKPWLVLDGSVSYEDYPIKSGKGSAPSIETIYNPLTAPGLGAQPTYIHAKGTAGIDWRSAPTYSRTGGFYGATLHNYSDSDDALSFQLLDANFIQHIPILRETWVLSFHGQMVTTLGDDDTVPFFLLPSLGSGHSLRAYSSWRFRDRHSLLTQAEFRWIPNRLGMDMGLFYDAGKVASRREDLDFDGLKSDWGVGVRFHALRFSILRIEAARGSEGWNLVFSTSSPF
jgi:hypothetical protein